MITSLLTGCQSMAFYGDSSEQITYWIEQEQYRKALDALALQPDNEPTKALNKQVTVMAKEKTTAVIQQAKKLKADKQWADARSLLKKSIGTLPDSEKLNSAFTDINASEQKEYRYFASKEAISQAYWLVESERLQQHHVNNANVKFISELKLSSVQSDKKNLSQKLADLGIELLAHNNNTIAKKCFDAAIMLDPNIKETSAGAELHATLYSSINKQQSKEKQTLVNTLDSAIKSNNYQAAQQTANQLQGNKKIDNQTQEKVTAISRFVEEKIDYLDQEADRYYSNGDIVEASALWEMALELNEDNKEISEKLLRAQKILDKMHDLREDGHKADTDS